MTAVLRNIPDPAARVQEFLRLGGRVTHFETPDPEGRSSTGKMTVTVAYWPSVAGVLFFGGAVFRPDDATPLFTYKMRRAHNETAVARFFKHANYITDPVKPADVATLKNGELDYKRREFLAAVAFPKLGVRGGKIRDASAPPPAKGEESAKLCSVAHDTHAMMAEHAARVSG